MGRCGDAEMGGWGDAEMGRWGDGEMGRYGDGEMRRYGDGEDGEEITHTLHLSTMHDFILVKALR